MAVIDITPDLTIDRIVLDGAPRPLLTRTAEARLGATHRDVLTRLDQLLMANGFTSFTIVDLAREVGCSRRTLYEIAPSKEQLVLIVLDRRLHSMGRAALGAIDPASDSADQIRQYIQGAIGHEVFSPMMHDLVEHAPALRLVERHYRFSMSVVQRLVSIGIDRGEFAPIDPAIVAAVVTGSSHYFMASDVISDTGVPLAELVSGMLDLVLAGLN